MFQPAPGEDYISPEFTLNGQKLPVADKFTYLGSTLSHCVHIDEEVTTSRISKASAAFGRLRNNVWDWQGLSLSTKLKVYRVIVLSTLLYACETWTIYQRHAKKWIGFTSHAYANFYGSFGVTLKSWDALNSPVSKLCSPKLSCAGQAMLSACNKNVCPKDCCMVSFWKKRDLLEVNVSGTRIRWRYCSTTSTLTQIFGKN